MALTKKQKFNEAARIFLTRGPEAMTENQRELFKNYPRQKLKPLGMSVREAATIPNGKKHRARK
jgi:hypothetical protein